MMLKQITDPAEILTTIQANFVFETTSDAKIMLHEIHVEGQHIGYVATEDIGTIGGPHIFIKEGYRNKPFLKKVGWLHRNVYCPLMKELGKEYLITTCATDDRGTRNFLTLLGFDVKEHVIAQYKL